MAEATAYATVAQLAAVLKVSATTREADLIRHLEAGAKHIDSEIGGDAGIAGGWSDDPQALELLTSVNLDVAQETWEREQVPAGIIGLGSDTPLVISRHSWERHKQRLMPLKAQFGFA